MLAKIIKEYLYPVVTLTGSIIGVGFLSLPYIALQVGMVAMLFYFVILTALVVVIHVMFGRVSLVTPDFKRWPGFVGFYLGPYAKKIVLATTIAGSLGVLLIYIIVGGQFLRAILAPVFGGGQFFYGALYFIAASACVYFGVRAISKMDFLALSALVFIVGIIVIKAFAHIHLENIFISNFKFQISNSLLPYGAIIFSLWSIGLIPEIEEMVIADKKLLTPIIIVSTLLAAAFYLVFIFLILGISGTHTSESSLLGLAPFLGRPLAALALCIGVITTFIAFVAQGLLLKKVFMYDMGVKELPAFLYACGIPLVLYLAGFNQFIVLISFIGGVLLSIDGILVLLMYKKIGGKKAIIYPLMIFFVLGIVYEVMYFVR